GDGFVTKLNVSGTALVYSTYLGGSGWDRIQGIAVDGTGIACVVGFTDSPNFPTAGALQGSLAGGFDGFVAALSASGTALRFSTYLGGTHDDSSVAITIGGDGSALVAGNTNSFDFPTMNSLYPVNNAPSLSIGFVARVAEIVPPTTPTNLT